MVVRYEVTYQLADHAGSYDEITETTSINMGFVQAAVRAQHSLPSGAEIVSITFVAVQ